MLKEDISKHEQDLKENKKDMNDSSSKILQNITDIQKAIEIMIKGKESESLDRFQVINATMDRIENTLKCHSTRHDKLADFTTINKKSLDFMSDHFEVEFRQAKEKQFNNDQFHQKMTDKLARFQLTVDKSFIDLNSNLQVI
jgi:hypothetical protein